jgi:hypothetical protein
VGWYLEASDQVVSAEAGSVFDVPAWQRPLDATSEEAFEPCQGMTGLCNALALALEKTRLLLHGRSPPTHFHTAWFLR